MRVWSFFLGFLQLISLHGFTPHIEELQNVPSPIQKYRLIDIGETTISKERLSRLHKGLSYAPSINNNSQIAWNSLEGGTLKTINSSSQEFVPRFEGMNLYIMGVNDEGDLLISIERGNDSAEWLLWPYDGANYNNRQHIHTHDPFSPDLVLRGLNRDGRVVGYFKKDGAQLPAAWSKSIGLNFLEDAREPDVLGMARDINDNHTVVGLYEEMKVGSPFVWNQDTGFEVMKNYREKLFPVGWMEFADILITSDDVVYGNYWLKHGAHEDSPKATTHHYGYMWKPKDSEIEQLELEGMRLTSVNHNHTLVGTWQGRAAIRKRDRRPSFLEQLMSQKDVEGWELLEATGINDNGQVIGFGIYKEKVHIFLAQPTE